MKQKEQDLRVKLCAERLENFFPVLMESQTAARSEANHMSRVELPVDVSNVMIRCINLNLHIERSKSVTTRRQRDTNTVVESMRLVTDASILRLIEFKVDL